MKHLPFLTCLLAALWSVALTPADSRAAAFAARISPPNFELRADPGDTVRRTITIQNSGEEAAEYVVRTADWDLSDSGGVQIRPQEAGLAENSCRPWTRIERPRIKFAPDQVRRYRFEVRVPEDAPPGECRFGILIAPAPETVDATQLGTIAIPVAGQIAIIVYVTIGDAQANLEIENGVLSGDTGNRKAHLVIHNHGNAHGRPYGNLRARSSDGSEADVAVVPFPVLAGRTARVALQSAEPNADGAPARLTLEPPVTIDGLIEWDGGSRELEAFPLAVEPSP